MPSPKRAGATWRPAPESGLKRRVGSGDSGRPGCLAMVDQASTAPRFRLIPRVVLTAALMLAGWL